MINGNYGSSNAGAIWIDGSNARVYMEDCLVESNAAGLSGGAMYCASGASTEIYRTELTVEQPSAE